MTNNLGYRYYFWRSFEILALVVLVFFGISNWWVGNLVLFYWELGLSLILWFNLVSYNWHKNLIFSSETLLVVVMLALLLMYLTGGVGDKTGVYWYFVLPISAFFLLDRIRAYIHILALVLITILAFYFSSLGLFVVPYTFLETRQILVAYLVVTYLIDLYKKRIDLFQNELEEKNEELATNIQERDAEYYKKEESLRELEKNKLAMLNLLEDARELESQLKIEKESVEKKVEERTKELSQEKQRLFSFLSSIPEGIFVLDAKGVPFFVNKTAETILGTGLKRVNKNKLAVTYKAYVAGTNTVYPSEKQPITMALLGKSATVSDMEIERDGKRLPIRVTGAPVYDAEGKVEYGIVVFQDITEEVILNRSKDEFFSIASHELRTPLTAIRGNASMIKEMYLDKVRDKDFEDMISDIHEGSVRLISLVNEFLDLGRLEQGKIGFKKEKIKVVSLVEEIKEGMQSILDEKKGSVEFVNRCGKEVVYADSERLRMVLTNLIGNSLKFTEIGKVVVETKQGKGGTTRVRVTDTGSGISASNQQLLFRKFQQAGTSIYTRDTSKGTGLGLYVSRLMVEGMGGSIWLEKSEVGKGSAFVFSLPSGKLEL